MPPSEQFLMKKTLIWTSAISLSWVLTGCAGGGGYAASMGNSGLGTLGQSAMGSVVNSAVGSVTGGQGGIMNAIIQNMAASVLNGQIGQQIQPADQSFRLQELAGATQTGEFDQATQWVNPRTGSKLSLQPVGPATVDPYTHQNCRDLEEIYVTADGREIREPRRMCQGADGKWAFVQ